MGPRRQRNQHIEVQFTQLARLETLAVPYLGKDYAGFKPVVRGRREDSMVLSISLTSLASFGSTAPLRSSAITTEEFLTGRSRLPMRNA